MGEATAEIEGFPGFGHDFRLYATGRSVSFIGDRIALIALVFLVIHLSKSYAPAIALFYVCQVLPNLIGGLLAGVLADQFDRRHLMIACDLGRAALMLVVPTVTSLQLWVLFPLVLALYSLTVIFNTAAVAALPDVVPESRMIAANSILTAIRTSADLAYALGGVLVFALGLRAPFYIDAVTFLFSAAMITAMRIPHRTTAPTTSFSDFFSRVRDGIEFLWAQPFLKWSTITLMVAPFAGGIVFVLTPLYANSTLTQRSGLVGPLSSGVFRFSLLEVAVGAGAVAGSFLVSRLTKRWPAGTVFGLGILGVGAFWALLALISNIYLAVVAMIFSGLFNALFFIPGETLAQTLSPSALRGRVVAARSTIVTGSIALGSAVGGILVLNISYRWLWLILGCVISASSLLIWLHPDVRQQEAVRAS